MVPFLKIVLRLAYTRGTIANNKSILNSNNIFQRISRTLVTFWCIIWRCNVREYKMLLNSYSHIIIYITFLLIVMSLRCRCSFSPPPQVSDKVRPFLLCEASELLFDPLVLSIYPIILNTQFKVCSVIVPRISSFFFIVSDSPTCTADFSSLIIDMFLVELVIVMVLWRCGHALSRGRVGWSIYN